MNITDTKIEEARAKFQAMDERVHDLPMYVACNDDPVQALNRIAGFLRAGVGDSIVLALIYVALCRVIDSLERFQIRRIMEQRLP